MTHVEGGISYTYSVVTGEAFVNTSNSGATGSLVVQSTITVGVDTYDVIGIDTNAFFGGNTTLTNLVIQPSVDTIGESAFRDCTGLLALGFPSTNPSFTDIATSVCQGCSSLTFIGIPNSITSIGASAFRDSGLENISFGETASGTIGSSAFQGCNFSSTNVYIQNGFTTIGASAFRDSGLESVTLPTNASFTIIDSSTFQGCTDMTFIAIPDSVETIGGSAFRETGLEEVSFGALTNLTDIGANAFESASTLTRITLPDSIATNLGAISTNVWLSSGLSTVYMTTTLATYLGTPASNSPQSFYGATDVNVVTLEITNTTLASDNLTLTVTFNESVYSTDGGSGSLETSDFVFSLVGGTATLASEPGSISEDTPQIYTLGLTLSGIADGAEVVTVNPASYTSIYDAYGGPASVTQSNNTVTLNGVYQDGQNVWYEYSGTTATVIAYVSGPTVSGAITIPSTITPDGTYDVTSIEDEAFRDVTLLTSIIIDNSVTTIGDHAFRDCSGLDSVTLPTNASFTTIESNTFLGCSILTSITIPNNVTIIDTSAFQDASLLAEVRFGASSGLLTIGTSAFHHTSDLLRITLPNSLTAITGDAWGGSSGLDKVFMTSVTGATLGVSEGFQAFYGASVTVYFEDDPPTITDTSLASDNSTITVTFSEDVYNTSLGSGSLETSDFVFSIAGGTATLASTEPSSISASAPYILGLNLSGIPDGTEVVTVNPASDASIFSNYGMAAAVPQSSNFVTLNAIPPTITDTTGAPDNSTITVTFSEAVFNAAAGALDVGDFVFSLDVPGTATLASPTPSSCVIIGNEYTLGLSLSGTVSGSEVVAVNPASATSIYNAAGTAASVTQSNNTHNLNVRPTITGAVMESDNATITVTFNKPVFSTAGGSGALDVGDFSLPPIASGVAILTSSTPSSITEDGLEYTLGLSLSGAANGSEEIVVDIATDTSVYDSLGYAAAETQSSATAYLVEYTMTVASTVADGGTSPLVLVPLTFTSSADTTDFDSTDIAASNGEISDFAGSGSSYTATFSPFVDGLCTAVVEAGTFANGTSQASTPYPFSWTYDGTGPVMTISSSDVTSGSATRMKTIAMTFTSSESTTDFESADITTSNGEISDFSGSDKIYTATFTSVFIGECSVWVDAATFQDETGNPNSVSHTFAWAYDMAPPTMTVTSLSLGSGSSTSAKGVYIVFTSSEPTTDFFPGDISFSGGTLSRFTCVDCNSAGTVYTVLFTIESACVTGSIWVEAGKFTDSAGYTNEASNVFEWIYIPACPIAPILPTGVLAPSSGNISAKMRQAQRIKYSTAHGGMRYVSNRPTVDTLIRPIGQIYYAQYITFYYYAKALTISQFLSTIPWSNYGNTAAESLQFAAIYLTMLFNVQRRLSAELLLPYYRTSTYVYYLKYVDGCILNYNQISGDFSRLELTGSTKYYFIFNNLS